jgi:hypothetical protein
MDSMLIVTSRAFSNPPCGLEREEVHLPRLSPLDSRSPVLGSRQLKHVSKGARRVLRDLLR